MNLNKGSMVLEPVESIFCFHLSFEEQHQIQPPVWGSSLKVIIDISTRELPHRRCTTSTTPSWQEQGKLEWPDYLLASRITTSLPWSLILQKRWYVHPLSHSILIHEFVWISVHIIWNQTQQFVLCLLYMVPVVGLHMFYSLLIILMLVNKYHYRELMLI